MKTITLSSKLLNSFLIYQTSKNEAELIDELKKLSFSPEQELHKKLIYSNDLKFEVHSNHTYKSNKDTDRYNALSIKEREGLNYIGANRGEEPVHKKSLEEFSKYYLSSIKANLSEFSTYFTLVGLVITIQIVIGMFILFFAFKNSDGIAIAFQQLISLGMLIWLAMLAKQFIRIQMEKVENDISNTILFRKESKKMSEDITKKIEQKAANKITVMGDNAMIAVDGGSISGSSQVKNVQGETELVKSLALLVSYCEEFNEAEALKAANQLTEEAVKANPDKGVVFGLWNKIISEIPKVSEVVSIANSVKTLIGL